MIFFPTKRDNETIIIHFFLKVQCQSLLESSLENFTSIRSITVTQLSSKTVHFQSTTFLGVVVKVDIFKVDTKIALYGYKKNLEGQHSIKSIIHIVVKFWSKIGVDLKKSRPKHVSLFSVLHSKSSFNGST